MNARLVKGGLTTPRISTFGIGEVLVILLHRLLPLCFMLIAFYLTIVGLMTSSLPHFVGSYCNHYFLQMLAQTGRGYYDAAFDLGWSQYSNSNFCLSTNFYM